MTQAHTHVIRTTFTLEKSQLFLFDFTISCPFFIHIFSIFHSLAMISSTLPRLPFISPALFTLSISPPSFSKFLFFFPTSQPLSKHQQIKMSGYCCSPRVVCTSALEFPLGIMFGIKIGNIQPKIHSENGKSQ